MSNKLNNDIMVALGILSILTLILLFRRYKNKNVNTFNNTVSAPPKKEKKKVRINPVPIFSPMMGKNDKYWENVSAESGNKIVILMCYADWCHNCTELKPIFTKLVRTQPLPSIQFAMVEEKEQGTSEYKKYLEGLEGYPTIKVINNGLSSEYRGPRERQSILTYAKTLKYNNK
jgi:thiol-disulfide isomerase/thioredoxin